MDNTAQKIPDSLQKTPLWQLHVDMGGKMVPFAGYDMPVQYADMGVLKEHLHTRSAAGLFDVSHMGQCVITDDSGGVTLEKIMPGDICGLEKGKVRYTVLLNDAGGIVDDLMVTRWDNKTFYIVVNAACKDKDFAWIQKKIGAEIKLQPLADRALLALQGPFAESVTARLFPVVTNMKFMTSLNTSLDGNDIFISRSGYTGEDGFEISIPNAYAVTFAKKLLAYPEVRWIGLGARDSLRLEAGLCLYGHDMDDATTPIEANLKWVIPKRRREEKNFLGAEKILTELAVQPRRLRVGLQPEGKAPIREGAELYSGAEKIGTVTSGGFGPTVNAPVAMGYVDVSHSIVGTKITALVRGQHLLCTVVTLPFIKQNYKKD